MISYQAARVADLSNILGKYWVLRIHLVMVLMFCAQWTENDKQTEQQCPTVPSWDPAQRDLSHPSFPQSLSIMLLLFSSCRESPNNFLPIVWQTWLCAVSGCHQSAVTMDRHSRHTGRCRPLGPCRHCRACRGLPVTTSTAACYTE